MKIHPNRAFALLVVLALLLGASACSDGEDDAGGTKDEDTSERSNEEWELTGEAEAKDVSRNGEAPPAIRAIGALMCRSAGKAETFGFTPEMIQRQLTGPGRSMDGYVQEMSYGALALTGSRAFGWFDLPRPTSAYTGPSGGVEEIVTDCAAAATAAGVDLSPFNTILAYTNDTLNGSVAAGTATGITIQVGGQPKRVTPIVAFDRGLNSPPLIMHELGHVIGGTHTNSRTDPLGGGSGFGDRWTAPFNPKRNAAITPGWDASTRDAAGWIPAARKARHAGGTATYTIARLTQPGPNGALLVDVPIGSTQARYVLGVRTRVGYDDQGHFENVTNQAFPKLGREGVVIERVERGRDTVAQEWSTTDENRSTWIAGETFTDTANGITVRIDTVTADGATVTVTAPGAPAETTTTTTAPPATTTTTTAPPATTAPATTAPNVSVPTETAPVEPTTTTTPPTGGNPSDAAADAPTIALPANLALNTGGMTSTGEQTPCASIGSTVWVKLTMPASGEIDVTTVGSDFDTVLAFYADVTGGAGAGNLTNIGCVDDANGSAQANGPMRGPAGGTLYIQVGGYRAATGNLVLKVTAK